MQRCVAALHLPSSFVIYLVGNSQSYCHPLKETSIQQAGFENYNQVTLAFIGVIVGASCALALAAFAYENFDNHEASNLNQPLTSADKDYALETLGSDSVYHFFVGKSCWGWLIVLATVAFQGWLLFFFVDGSEIDLSDDKVDVVYTWKCTRDKETCIDTKDLDGQGWLACTLVLILYLLEDVINGVKMILLCVKQRFDLNDRIRFFIGGTILTTITLLTMFVSTIYNLAIATSEYFWTDYLQFHLFASRMSAECLVPPHSRRIVPMVFSHSGNTDVLVNSVLILFREKLQNTHV